MNLDTRDTLLEVRQDITAALAGLDFLDQTRAVDESQIGLIAEAKLSADVAMQAVNELLDQG